jgi:type VI secretion system protein ImpB
MPESIQHKLDRVRPPRVQITYDVEVGDAIEKKELPFVVGIMADLSGMQDKELTQKDRHDPASANGKMRDTKPAVTTPKPLKERKYIEIDPDNFDKVMESIAPRLVFSVKNVTARPYTDAENSKYRKDHGLREGEKIPQMYTTDPDATVMQPVELEFLNLDDFSPINIVKQVAFLRNLLEARNRLSDLLTKLDGNVDMERALVDVLGKGADDLKKIQDEKGGA